MCGPSASEESDRSTTSVAEEPTTNSAVSEYAGTYMNKLGDVVVVLNNGVGSYIHLRELAAEEEMYGDIEPLRIKIDRLESSYGFRRVGFIEKEPAEVAEPEDTLQSRLEAAQTETGYVLFDVVRNKESRELGQVVGFGRVNDADALDADEPDRVVLVQFDNDTVLAATPDSIDHVASPALAHQDF